MLKEAVADRITVEKGYAMFAGKGKRHHIKLGYTQLSLNDIWSTHYKESQCAYPPRNLASREASKVTALSIACATKNSNEFFDLTNLHVELIKNNGNKSSMSTSSAQSKSSTNNE